MQGSNERPIGLLAVLRQPGAARLWLAGFAVSIMRWLEMLAFSLFALAATGSPLIVALTIVCRMAPLLLATVLLTALAERFGRQRALVAAFALMTGLFACLLLVELTCGVGIGLVLLASLAAGLFWSLEFPLRRTMLAEIGGLARVGASMGLEIAANQITRVAGAVIGGASVAWLGLIGVFAIGLSLYAVGTVLVATAPHPVSSPTVGTARLLAGIRDGLRAVRGNGLLQGTIAVSAIFNLFGFPYMALAPVIAERRYGLTADLTGLLMAVEPLAATFGALLFAARAPDRLFRLLYALGPLLFVCGTALFALAGWLPLATLALSLAGFGMAAFAVGQMVLPMRAAPASLRTPVVGLVATSIGVAPFGLFQAGLLAEWFGAVLAQQLISLGGLLSMLLALSRWPQLLTQAPPDPLNVPR